MDTFITNQREAALDKLDGLGPFKIVVWARTLTGYRAVVYVTKACLPEFALRQARSTVRAHAGRCPEAEIYDRHGRVAYVVAG